MSDKIKLSYINGGKPFDLPKMTMKRQEAIMEKMVELEDTYTGDKLNREVNKYILLKTLEQIDDKMTMAVIDEMHPDDFMQVFSKLYGTGRELTSDDKDFREKKTSEATKTG